LRFDAFPIANVSGSGHGKVFKNTVFRRRTMLSAVCAFLPQNTNKLSPESEKNSAFPDFQNAACMVQ